MYMNMCACIYVYIFDIYVYIFGKAGVILAP